MMEFLPGKEYSVDMYVGSKKIFSLPRCRKCISSGISHSTYLEKNEYLIKLSSLFARHINYEGILGMQFKDDLHGKPMILECNPRVQGSMVISTISGANLIKMAIEEKLTNKINHNCKINWNTSFERYYGGYGFIKNKYRKYNRDFIYNSQFQKVIKKYKNIFFDLDHTLFNEYEFLYNKYLFYLSKHKLSNKRKKDIISFMMKNIIYGKRKELIQKINKYFYEEFSISLFLKNLRSKENIKINLFRGVKLFLNKLIKNDYEIFLYTSGNLHQQKNKVEILKLNQFSFKILFMQMEIKET